MTDSAQELDEILDGFARAVRVVVVNGLSHDKYERRQKDFKQAILDWHNKQTLELLDRLETSVDDGKKSHSMAVISDAIETERAKLKEAI